MIEEHSSLKQIIDFRLEKLKKIIDSGVNPYPYSYSVSYKSEEILNNEKQLEGETVTIAGRIMSLRKMGKASFCHIQDEVGRIQIYVRRDDIGVEAYKNFKLLDIGDFIGVEGYVFKTKMGETSIHASLLTILSKSIRPIPIVKEKEGEEFDSFADKEQRYRNRHLDLVVNHDVKETFVKRAKIITSIRQFFDNDGFIEVETPILQSLYGGANARPFHTHHNSLDQKFYMRIADELYLKRLIIGGFEKVYELAKNFRNEGMDRNHNPEFTSLEFYQAYVDYEYMMNFVEKLIQTVANKIGDLKLTWGDMEIDLSKKFIRKPIFALLSDATGTDVSQLNEKELIKICDKFKIDVSPQSNYGQILDLLMSKLVEPTLIQPIFVIDYPKVISPLAKKHRSGNPELVERFELFIGGMEFANAFSELNDPIDQRERFESQAKLGKAGDEEAHPVDENFLQAIESGMPPTGGVGIGIDRLVMLLTNNRWIKDVILFPTLRDNS
jgi:lysyl-tRNA synthetase class 2